MGIVIQRLKDSDMTPFILLYLSPTILLYLFSLLILSTYFLYLSPISLLILLAPQDTEQARKEPLICGTRI
jgi:hypothetical protein